MKCHAAHYIYHDGKIFKQHYLELNDRGCLKGIFPLTHELPKTIFHNAVLFLTPEGVNWNQDSLHKQLQTVGKNNSFTSITDLLRQVDLPESRADFPVNIYRINILNDNAVQLHKL